MDYKTKNRGSALVAIVATIAIALLIVGLTYITTQPPERHPTADFEEGIPATPEKKANNGPSHNGRVLAREGALVIDFNQADYDEALQSNKLIVLYFYASWCPLCKEEFPKMIKAFANLPADEVIGFRVNFNDTSTDDDERNLASEFGVAYQHTKVFVQNSQRILKSPETWDQDRYGQVINSLLNR